MEGDEGYFAMRFEKEREEEKEREAEREREKEREKEREGGREGEKEREKREERAQRARWSSVACVVCEAQLTGVAVHTTCGENGIESHQSHERAASEHHGRSTVRSMDESEYDTSDIAANELSSIHRC